MNKELHLVSDCVSCVVFVLRGYLLGARKSRLGILLPCTMSDGIRVKVFPECVDISPKLV